MQVMQLCDLNNIAKIGSDVNNDKAHVLVCRNVRSGGGRSHIPVCRNVLSGGGRSHVLVCHNVLSGVP